MPSVIDEAASENRHYLTFLDLSLPSTLHVSDHVLVNFLSGV